MATTKYETNSSGGIGMPTNVLDPSKWISNGATRGTSAIVAGYLQMSWASGYPIGTNLQWRTKVAAVGDFDVSWYVYRSGSTLANTLGVFIGTYDDTTWTNSKGFLFSLTSTDVRVFDLAVGGTYTTKYTGQSQTYNTWYQMRVKRVGNQWSFYWQGTLLGTFSGITDDVYWITYRPWNETQNNTNYGTLQFDYLAGWPFDDEGCFKFNSPLSNEYAGGHSQGSAAVIGNVVGEAGTITVTGTGFRVYGSPGPNRGKMNVYADGALLSQVDWYAASYTTQQRVYEFYGLGPGKHKLKFETPNPSAKNPLSTNTYLVLDYIEVIDDQTFRSRGSKQPTTKMSADSKTIALWHCGEGTGTTVRDYKGYPAGQCNATLGGGYTVIADPPQLPNVLSGVRFDSLSGGCYTNRSWWGTRFEPTRITVEIKTSLDYVPNSQPRSYPQLVAKYTWGDNAGYVMLIDMRYSIFYWRIYANGAWRDVSVDCSSWEKNKVMHLTGTFDGRYSILYKDGVELKRIDLGGTYNLVPGTRELCFGYNSTAAETAQSYYGGVINVIRIWGRALTPAQVQYFAQNPTTGYEDQLLGDWDFTRLSSNIVLNKSVDYTNSDTFTNVNWVDSKLGKALGYPGTSAYVGFPNEQIFDFPNTTFTVEAIFQNANIDNARRFLVGKGRSSYWQWGIEDSGNGYMQFDMWDASGNAMATSVPIKTVDNAIHYMAAIVTTGPIPMIDIFVDGVWAHTETLPFAGWAYNSNGDCPVMLGARGKVGTYTPELFWRGNIHDVRISSARTKKEIEAQYAKMPRVELLRGGS